MKKYLIALPLVLIMILSMVPVMADTTIHVDVVYYDGPDSATAKPIKSETRQITISDKAYTDKALAEKEVAEKVLALNEFPDLNSKLEVTWRAKAEVTPFAAGASTFSAVPVPTSDATLAVLKGLNPDLIFDLGDLTVDAAQVAQASLEAKIKTAVDKIVAAKNAGKTPTEADRTVTVEATDFADAATGAPAALDVYIVSESKADDQPFAAEAKVYPNCYVDPKDPVKPWCPELCDDITVLVYNAFTGYEIEGLRRTYDVDPHKVPTYEGIVNHFKKTYLTGSGYQVLKNWNGKDNIRLPYGVDGDCVIVFWVLPVRQYVNVLHVMQDCCIELDGTVSYFTTDIFQEVGASVDFIAYHSELMIDHNKAKDFAKTRLQRLNATDYVFFDAQFDDGLRLDGYMTGNVYDMNGNVVTIIEDTNPVIRLIYHRAECEKDEEKVDNATVENNTNTQAPVTASGTQLPATGAKDVTAFFLSAVALLGLGIFFAKKH